MGKFCSNCGAQVSENENFCHSCGVELKKELKESNDITSMQYNSQPSATSREDYFSEAYLKETFLSRDGRLGRFSYFKRMIVLEIVRIMLLVIVEWLLLKEWETMNTPCAIVESLISLFALYPDYCLTVRRIKDINKSLSLANIYIFIAGIYTIGASIDNQFIYSAGGKLLVLIYMGFAIYFLFTPGTNGANQYGEDPTKI